MTEPIKKLPVKSEQPTTPAGAFAPQHATFDSLRREIDRVFDSFNWGSWGFPFARTRLGFEMPSLRSASVEIAPAVDVAEKDKEYEITAELPGLDEKNIEVKLANGMLTIRGEKKEEKEEKQTDYHLSERSYGSFMRSFQLPEGIDEGKIEASFVKGVLTVKVPKSTQALKNEKTISIKAA
ncbi:MAG: Hsp20/alpha crystallin family protein [Beijerinckiaceae bacterium]